MELFSRSLVFSSCRIPLLKVSEGFFEEAFVEFRVDRPGLKGYIVLENFMRYFPTFTKNPRTFSSWLI